MAVKNFIALKYNPESRGWWGVFRPRDGVKDQYPPLGTPDWADLETAIAEARKLGFDPGERSRILAMNPDYRPQLRNLQIDDAEDGEHRFGPVTLTVSVTIDRDAFDGDEDAVAAASKVLRDAIDYMNQDTGDAHGLDITTGDN